MSIIHALVRLIEVFWPPRDAHRVGCLPSGPRVAPPRPAPPLRRTPRPHSLYGLDKPLDGDAQQLVRPYVIAHEQRQRRRVLYAAVALGVDLDHRDIHAGVA